MKKHKYDVFISYPLTERKNELSGTINTKDFYVAKNIYTTLTHLLGVKTFFSEETLLHNNSADFWEKIKEIIPQSKVLVVILSNPKDYEREFCKKERDLYLDRNQDDRKIFFLVSHSVHRNINSCDIMTIEKGKPEVIRWEEIPQQQKFYNEINNYFRKNDSGNVKEVKICKKCRKIFYKGSEKSTICIHHDEKTARRKHFGKNYYVKFNCCNKKVALPNKNALYEISPGCIEERNHEFDD